MKIWKDISTFKAKNPVVTIGSFDGVHKGHRHVIKRLNSLAKDNKGESVVFTFSPHPVRVLYPEKEFVLLTTIEEKIYLFEKTGIDHLVIFPFTKEFSKLSYPEFVKNILIDKMHIHTLLVGHDNSIGKGKQGNFNQLITLSEKYGFSVAEHDELILEDSRVNSTLIRSLLTQGRLYDASKLLGYPYMLSGTVISGQRLGNKLGFPTANILPPENKFIPGNGVYAILVEYNKQTYKGMMNIGIRPTIDDEKQHPVIEAHLFNFNGNLYGKYISISIIRKLRDEFKFNTVEALRQQLKKDKEFALVTLEKEFGIK